MTEPLFELILQEIGSELAPQGFQKTKQQHQPQLSDTRYAVFDGTDKLVRVIWDGRQRTLAVRVYAKRKFLSKLAKVLIGQNDTEKLVNETTIRYAEMSSMTDEQIVRQCVLAARTGK
ncbi:MULTISPECIES: hypothetical protein [Cohnella]|uniref:hypothetical protein n=1 Tax=Cohnella TaxID=329857 RepID=UPI0009B9B747|nr:MULTISPECIES: hypothetical protein [Cohnella]MBN2984488.1 hypothetical protein [Cohnella algarum]